MEKAKDDAEAGGIGHSADAMYYMIVVPQAPLTEDERRILSEDEEE